MGLFSSNNDHIELNRDDERRATDYKFKPKVTEKELKKNGLKLVQSIDEWDGMELAERNPRLFTLVVTIMAEVERLQDAGDETRKFAKKTGRATSEVEREIQAMVHKSTIAELAYMINAYTNKDFMLD